MPPSLSVLLSRLRNTRFLAFAGLVFVCLVLAYARPFSAATPARIPGLRPEDRATFASHAVNNTVVIVPANLGMMNWVDNLICSLRSTSFDPQSIVFWALDTDVQEVLAHRGFATYHDPSLYAVTSNENKHGNTAAYKKMMQERPKFYMDVLSTGFDILMLDADTVFWQSPLSIMPTTEERDLVDLVYSTDAREFYQVHDAFQDGFRRGPYIPPVCNGIFWMKSNPATMAIWSRMLEVFKSSWTMARLRFNDDQRGMDVILNDGRAQLVEPFPGGIKEAPESPQSHPDLSLSVRLLDQTQVVSGHLLLNRQHEYEEFLADLRNSGKARIAAHFNWDAVDITKEDGAKQLGLMFIDANGKCTTHT